MATHDVLIFDMTHSYVTRCFHMRHDSCICDAETWLMHMWRGNRHCWSLCESWLHLGQMTNICVYIYIYIYIACIYIAYMYLATHDVWIIDMTHPYVTRCIHMWRDSCICDAAMGTAEVFANIDFASGRWQMCVYIYIYMCSYVFIYCICMWTHDVLIFDTTHSYVTQYIHMRRDSCICHAATGTAEILAVAPADRDVASGRWHMYIHIYICIFIFGDAWLVDMWHDDVYVIGLIYMQHDTFIRDITNSYRSIVHSFGNNPLSTPREEEIADSIITAARVFFLWDPNLCFPMFSMVQGD